MRNIDKKLIEAGIRVADSKVFQQDKIWSRYSNDKVNIGDVLAKVLRTLDKALPLSKDLRVLSIGSSNEPQFRILEPACRGGLYLLDIEKEALGVVKERIHRQATDHIILINDDFNKIFLNLKDTQAFFISKLHNQKIDLVLFHHSLYYSEEKNWHTIFENIYRRLLAPKGAIHAVLMASKSSYQFSTTWLYNHFAGKFCGHYNDQDLLKFKNQLKKATLFKNTQVLSRRCCVRFFVDDFEKFMSVCWMIFLYPDVHKYNQKQKEEITEFIYKKFWRNNIPLVQMQDHLVMYRGIGFRGLI